MSAPVHTSSVRSVRGEFRVEPPSRLVGRLVALLVFGFGVCHLISSPRAAIVLLFPSILLLIVCMSIFPCRVFVGEDGIVLAFVRNRFVPFGDIDDVLADGETGIRLRLKSGKSEVIRVTYQSDEKITPAERLRRDALYLRICEAWSAYRTARSAPADIEAFVGRGGRSRAEWRATLSRIGDEKGYRDVAMRSEDLWRALEDVRTPEDVRAGAAAVLSRSLDDEGRARVRVVAEATASPRLRVALDAVAQGPTQALEDALDDFAADVEPKKQRSVT